MDCLQPPSLLKVAILILFPACGIAGSFSADCLIEPNQTAALGSPVSGVIEEVSVKRGAKVSKGQVVARLASSVEQASTQLAKFKSEQTASQILAERKQAFARRKFERRQAMSAEKLMPEQDSDDSEAEFRVAEAEWLVAKENHQAAQLEYNQQKAQLEQKSIRSPFSGVVVEQAVYPGETVEPGANAKPILKLAQLDPLRVQVILPKSRFGEISVGEGVSLTPESPGGGSYAAKVKTVDKLIDAASGTFIVFLELPNPRLVIPAGIRCQARFQ